MRGFCELANSCTSTLLYQRYILLDYLRILNCFKDSFTVGSEDAPVSCPCTLVPNMRTLQLSHLRRPCVCRWLLGCLLLSWCLAYAAPLIHPAALDLVCSSAGGLRLVDLSTGEEASSSMPDCALCLTGGAPPPASAWLPDFIPPGPPTLGLKQRFTLTVASAAPPPARGPPVL